MRGGERHEHQGREEKLRYRLRMQSSEEKTNSRLAPATAQRFSPRRPSVRPRSPESPLNPPRCRLYAQTTSGNTDFCTLRPQRPETAAKKPGLRNVGIVDIRQCLGNRRGPGREAEAVEDLPDGIRWMHGAQDSHAPATALANQNINRKHTFEELSPGIVPGTGTAFLMAGWGLGWRDLCGTAGMGWRGFGFCLRDDERPPGSGRSKQPMIPHEMKPGRRHKGGKPGNSNGRSPSGENRRG